jgi:plastocyanin domain-containing protein
MKGIIISIIVAGAIIGGSIFLVSSGSASNGDAGTSAPANNVSVVDGKQIVEIRAKGGYQPRKSSAKAGLPTLIRFDTSGTFDCSSSVRIASLGISRGLPQTGQTDIDIGISKAGTLQGTCGMGMYPFEIDFLD